MKKYLSIIRGFFMSQMSFRFHFMFTSFGNLFYIVLIYFLWQAIYRSSGETIQGMTFNDTFVYLALATSIFGMFQTWTEWQMARSIQSGSIIIDFIRPMDYQLYTLTIRLSFVISNAIAISLPALILILFVFKTNINIGLNIIMFFIALVFAYLISFLIDFIIGLISFYTESIWGISITKEAVVLLLSGAIIPLPFFPDIIRNVVDILPFKAIYHIPLTILIDNSLTINNYLALFGLQIFWTLTMLAISRIFFRTATKVITVNGG